MGELATVTHVPFSLTHRCPLGALHPALSGAALGMDAQVSCAPGWPSPLLCLSPRCARRLWVPAQAGIVCTHRYTSSPDGQVLRYIMDNSQRETLLIIQTHTEGRKCTLASPAATRSSEAGAGCLFPHVTATQWVADSPERLAPGQEKSRKHNVCAYPLP